MAPPNKKDKETIDYLQAEKLINQTIANMDGTSHVEYGSLIERSDKTSSCSCLNRIKLLLKNLCKRF